MADVLQAVSLARADLVREIAIALHVARGGRVGDFDLPPDHPKAVPSRSYVWSHAGAVADRLMANQAPLAGIGRLSAREWSALGIQEGGTE